MLAFGLCLASDRSCWSLLDIFLKVQSTEGFIWLGVHCSGQAVDSALSAVSVMIKRLIHPKTPFCVSRTRSPEREIVCLGSMWWVRLDKDLFGIWFWTAICHCNSSGTMGSGRLCVQEGVSSRTAFMALQTFLYCNLTEWGWVEMLCHLWKQAAFS